MNLSRLTADYVDRPFGEHSCMGLLHSMYTALGADVPDQWEDLTLSNYMAAFKKDPRGTQIRMIKLMRSLGKRSSVQFPNLFDLLVVVQKGPGFFPAMYVGRGQAIASFLKTGVTVFGLDKHNRPIVARRIL